MREILFRGKRTDNGEWVYGSLLCFKGYSIHDTIWKNFIPVYSKTVGQYTGLTDLNGKKIFEGDIVRYSVIIMHTVVHEQIVKITFNKGSFCMEEMNGVSHPLFHSIDNTRLEVIGNIHDNPELLVEVEAER